MVVFGWWVESWGSIKTTWQLQFHKVFTQPQEGCGQISQLWPILILNEDDQDKPFKSGLELQH